MPRHTAVQTEYVQSCRDEGLLPCQYLLAVIPFLETLLRAEFERYPPRYAVLRTLLPTCIAGYIQLQLPYPGVNAHIQLYPSDVMPWQPRALQGAFTTNNRLQAVRLFEGEVEGSGACWRHERTCHCRLGALTSSCGRGTCLCEVCGFLRHLTQNGLNSCL